MKIYGEDGIVEGTIVFETESHGILVQVVKTRECGGRYYEVINGQQGFHSLDYERVIKDLNNSILRAR